MARTENLILNTDDKTEKTEKRGIRRLRFVAVLALVLIILINVAVALFPTIKKEFFPDKLNYDGEISEYAEI